MASHTSSNQSIDRVHIPTEPIGSLPRPNELIDAQEQYRQGKIDIESLNKLHALAIEDSIKNFEATGSPVITDGEQRKSSFFSYPIESLVKEYYSYSDDCFSISFHDGHQRVIPRLIKAPFKYGIFANTFVEEAKTHSKLPIKQAVIAPSALSIVYLQATIEGYSREQFLEDLINEAEKDIRKCFESGAHSVQLDFTEARYSLKVDPTGQLLRDFIDLNNRVLDRFDSNLRERLGVHICPGGDQDSHHSLEVDYLLILPDVFDLHVGNFFLQLASEPDCPRVLSRIRELLKPGQRVFVGVIDSINSRVETSEEVCERVLQAAEYIPVKQLGTTDDCGFSPFNDDRSTTRQVAFDKIRARIQGTKLAEEKLSAKNEQ